MLKVYKTGSDERNGATVLHYYDGNGAVHILGADTNAILLERTTGEPSLAAMALSGRDMEAAEILAVTVGKLHAKRKSPPPPTLTPPRDWFGSLFEHEPEHPQLARCAAVARGLLDTKRDVVVLHGDLHHENVLDGGPRGWLAIDPKGLIGERTYDTANLLGNPWPHGELVHSAARMQGLATLYADRLDMEIDRVVAFALAHAGLAASWDMDDGRDPAFRLRCAEILDVLMVDGRDTR
jgi:streptomycin 6-kinase